MGARGFEVTTGLIIQQGIFEQSLVAKHRVGARMQLADGRVFYYGRAGGTCAAGKLALTVTPGIANVEISAATEIGDTEITLATASSAVTAGMYDEGYIIINDQAGQGYTYKIDSHDLGAASSSTTTTFRLYDPIQVATVIGASVSEATVIANPFMDILPSATEEQVPAGIPLIAVTDEYYAWFQTWGVASCLSETTTADAATVGCNLVPAAVAGAVQALGVSTSNILTSMPIVGIQASGQIDTEYNSIILRLWP
jgi:hypothetical protein